MKFGGLQPWGVSHASACGVLSPMVDPIPLPTVSTSSTSDALAPMELDEIVSSESSNATVHVHAITRRPPVQRMHPMVLHHMTKDVVDGVVHRL